MLVQAWQFSTASYEPDERCAAWREAMNRLRIPLGRMKDHGPFDGRVSCQVSPLGMVFALVEADAMELSGSYTGQPAGIWLSVHVAGEGDLVDGGRRCELLPGDMIYAPTGVPATLDFGGRFCQLFVSAPRLALNPRVVVPMSLKLGRMSGQEGITKVFSGMLLALADVITQVKSHQLRPVELAITEFLMTSLESEKTAFGLGGAEGMKSSHLHRICQDIETRLSDPSLNLATVAESSGVSTRYLQKLFSHGGKSFSSYVRTRRLERCKSDLASPLHANLSISDICFRWGFNGSAHFSRIFRNEYGVSPRDFRRSVGTSSANDADAPATEEGAGAAGRAPASEASSFRVTDPVHG